MTVPSPAGPIPAVDVVSFDIADGETLNLVGETASGKSLTALSIPDPHGPGVSASGAITLEGRRLMGLSGLIMALVDARAALPVQILVLGVLALFGNAFWLFVALVGLAGWETHARLVRGAVPAAQQKGSVSALRAPGTWPWRLYAGHVPPNVANMPILQVTLNFPSTVLEETALSFLGLGIQPPLTSLVEMPGSGRDHLLLAWWIAVLPGMTIFVITLSKRFVGDWLRDALDPNINT